ncbi:MAG: S1 RNA-binding domain-containing protein, partial [Proteobacteria bacterium]|nr:S1 RNA-binding domain-containing protein [Pseudomonadota bacterium]
FVDIGVHQDGLVHVSVLADKFVKDPREVVRPGDIVKVKVLEVDLARKRIALSMRMDDGAAKPKPKREDRRPKDKPRQGKGGPKGKGPRPPQDPKSGGKPDRKPDAGGGAMAAAFAEAMKKRD